MADSYQNSPGQALWRTICDAQGVAADAVSDVQHIAQNLRAVGMTMVAEQLEFSVAGLTDALKRVRDAHGNSVNNDIAASHELTAGLVKVAMKMATLEAGAERERQP